MHLATSRIDRTPDCGHVAWYGMEIPACRDCRAVVSQRGEVCPECLAEREAIRPLIALLVDRGVAVERELV